MPAAAGRRDGSSSSVQQRHGDLGRASQRSDGSHLPGHLQLLGSAAPPVLQRQPAHHRLKHTPEPTSVSQTHSKKKKRLLTTTKAFVSLALAALCDLIG